MTAIHPATPEDSTALGETKQVTSVKCSRTTAEQFALAIASCGLGRLAFYCGGEGVSMEERGRGGNEHKGCR